MRPFLTALFLLSFLLTANNVLAQTTNQKSLLWRISGNGLSKPSYLYGTMHLKDRRLFFFGDSVYKAIENTDGFAMELDPHAMADSFISKMNDADTTTLLSKLLAKKDFDKVSAKLEKRLGVPANKITRRRLMEEREGWYNKIKHKDDMATAMDLYLYNIAEQKGKWVGGIEDVDDQFGLRDELGKDVDINTYINEMDEKAAVAGLDSMINLYREGDVGIINNYVTDASTENYNDLLLNHRNIKMAERMDSLARLRNSFFAVGAAHLGGSKGVIQLLKSKGFTVEPVISSQKIDPAKYVVVANDKPWVRFSGADSAYSVEMPGKPSDIKQFSEINFKAYIDFITNLTYMTAFTFVPMGENNDHYAKGIIDNFSDNGMTLIKTQPVKKDGIDGLEVIAAGPGLYYRIQVYVAKDKMFMAMAATDSKQNLGGRNIDRFFKSLVMNKDVEAKYKEWITYKDAAKAFEVTMPKEPERYELPEGESASNFQTTSYSLLDIKNNNYYVMSVNDSKKGYVITGDTMMFSAKKDYYNTNGSTVFDERQFKLEGFPAQSFSVASKEKGMDFITKLLIVSRGNRSYLLAVVSQKGREDFPEIGRFFRSFHLLPMEESVWSKQQDSSATFSSWSPAPFEKTVVDTTGMSEYEITAAIEEAAKKTEHIAHDAKKLLTFYITANALSKYYTVKNDSALFADELSSFYSDTASQYAKTNAGSIDSLLYYKPVMNGGEKGAEIMVKNATKSYYKRVRVLQHGDSCYQLYVLLPEEMKNDKNIDRFFNEFRFEKEHLPTSIYSSKTAMLLEDIKSHDSATLATARAALTDHKFDVVELPLFHKAYLYEYKKDSLSYRTIADLLQSVIQGFNDSSTITFVKENYTRLKKEQPLLGMGMLEMLASQQRKDAVLLIKELLLSDPPVKGYTNSFIYNIDDSLELAKELFPGAEKLLSDTFFAGGINKLMVQLIDSNLLKEDILKDNQQHIYTIAKAELKSLKADAEDYPVWNRFTQTALMKLGTKESIALLKQFSLQKDLYIKKDALINLAKLKQPLTSVDFQSLAADKDLRVSLYESLQKINKQSLFPAQYLSQQSFAEAYLYSIITEDYEDESYKTTLKLVGEKTATVHGKQNRYYLFKVGMTGEDGDVQNFLAVVGEFDLNKKQLLIKGDYPSYKLFEEAVFDASKINTQFQQFISEEENSK